MKLLALVLLPLALSAPPEEPRGGGGGGGGWNRCPARAPDLVNNRRWFRLIGPARISCHVDENHNSRLDKWFRRGDWVQIICQDYGEEVCGNNVWDWVQPGGCHVPDAYVETGVNGRIDENVYPEGHQCS